MYIDVIVEIGVKRVDNTFTYHVPSTLENSIKIGIRVTVPFGNMTLEGFVMNIYNDHKKLDYEIKDIIKIVDEEEVLTKEMLWLGEEISKITLCSLISAYQVMLPKALKAKNKTNIRIKEDKYLVLNKPEEEIIEYIKSSSYENQNRLLESILVEDKLFITKVDSATKTLINKGLIKIEYVEAFRYNEYFDKEYKEIIINEDQKRVIDSVTSNLNKDKTFLLHGVTGSGKTEVYIRIIEEVVKSGKEAIMLVPEISLTPQIIGRFKNKFGSDIAVLHSGLSDAERYDEYRKISSGIVHIAVGARSAVFAPFNNLGIIIIDEEHTTSYKQDNHPRYNTKDIAILRSKYHHCPVILGSATPTLDSYARASKNVYELLELKTRASKGNLPEVIITDMTKEMRKNNDILSGTLYKKIIEVLNKKEQIILFLNRRGFSSMITCKECGHVAKCPRCDISLTYHKTSNTLRCHYCGYGLVRKDICSNCHSHEIKDFGLGTEKVEETLSKLFPDTKIVRMDVDTTSKKGSHNKIITDFENHKYDILIGTQMIAKGLDFPNVTLVGIINADTSLNIPDFRSSERTFDLLCQVAGRAGRGSVKGEVVIQTFNPEHYAIKYAATHDYIGFYKEEMIIRQKLKYPPYYYIIELQIKSKDYKQGGEEANKISKYLKSKLNKDTIVLGPAMANMFRVNNIYHYRILIKYRKDDNLINTLKEIDNVYKTNGIVTVEMDTLLN